MGSFEEIVMLNSEGWVRLALAFILGGAIGLEREIHGRPAGLRTHILVCVSVTMIMVGFKSQTQLLYPIPADIHITIDPGRIVAGIMTGIGFLGAGAIIRLGDFIRGITTAACIWFAAALGIVIGEGCYALALLSTGSILIVLITLHWLEHHFHPVVYHAVQITVPLEKAEDVESRCQAILKKEHIRIQNKAYSISQETRQSDITFNVRMRDRMQSGVVIRDIAKISGVLEAHWK
ncbi:MAG TPA: MgtC/SapB family protein [Thermodesulfobacteriota bacterium]|nr:MgtC/SapB family protein [Thermodesulfobacteriota bacterium]